MSPLVGPGDGEVITGAGRGVVARLAVPGRWCGIPPALAPYSRTRRWLSRVPGMRGPRAVLPGHALRARRRGAIIRVQRGWLCPLDVLYESEFPHPARVCSGSVSVFPASDDSTILAFFEQLEERQLLAVDGPRLISINPNNGSIFNVDTDPGVNPGVDNILTVAPRDLTIRFSTDIKRASLDGIRITRSGFDGNFRTDFNTNGAVQVEFTQVNPDANVFVNVTKSNHSVTGSASGPRVTVSGETITIDLDTNPANLSTARQLLNALKGSAAASALVTAQVVAGSPDQVVASAEIDYSPIRPNVIVKPGYFDFGDSSRVVIARFAETLPDDLYRVEAFGFDDAARGITGVQSAFNLFLNPQDPNTDRDTIFFELDLGAQVVATVPQPVSRAYDIRLTGNPTSGSFRLVFDGKSTVPIPKVASAAAVVRTRDRGIAQRDAWGRCRCHGYTRRRCYRKCLANRISGAICGPSGPVADWRPTGWRSTWPKRQWCTWYQRLQSTLLSQWAATKSSSTLMVTT